MFIYLFASRYVWIYGTVSYSLWSHYASNAACCLYHRVKSHQTFLLQTSISYCL